METSRLEKDLKIIFEAGKKCTEDHPDDDTYDEVRFESAIKEISKELQTELAESKKPSSVKEAEKYINQCHSDMGFMGSPKYDEAKKTVSDYYTIPQKTIDE